MNKTKTKTAGESKLGRLVLCPYWDCGWCYSDEINEQNGCIGFGKCKTKHLVKWMEINPSFIMTPNALK